MCIRDRYQRRVHGAIKQFIKSQQQEMPGYQLLLEFDNQITSPKEFESNVSTLISSSCQQKVLKSTKIDKSNKFQLIYLLENSNSIFLTLDSKNQYLLINATFYDSDQLKAYEISKTFEIACLMNFNITNCIGTQLLAKSCNNSTDYSFLANDDVYKIVLFKKNELLHEEQTIFQKLRMLNNPFMGRVLVLDYMVQITSKLKDYYSEYLAKEIVRKGEKNEQILIIGAGDLKIPNHVLDTFPDVKKVTQCELDEQVVVNCLKYFQHSENLQGDINKGRLQIHYKDGSAFVREEAEKGNKYDGVIIDNTDVDLRDASESLIATVLFSVDFYKNIYKILNKGAAFSTQLTEMKNLSYFIQKAKDAGFEEVYHIMCPTPEYTLDTPVGIARRMA
eukprot:TRINITY_DN181_c0_g1_i7.p1 TRINITY_DN181_c0_g1~~TRINITY_DN181_c0_g1_i7.p1  ORF type:complete len:391 (-),score=76.30 TRINITY_DN181_c0_g1_i7:74-1246(-)